MSRTEARLRQRRNDLRHDLLLERGVREERKTGQVQPGADHDVLGSLQRGYEAQICFVGVKQVIIEHVATSGHS